MKRKQTGIILEVSFFSFIILLAVGYLQLISNSNHVASVSNFLRARSNDSSLKHIRKVEIEAQLRERLGVYLELIEAHHLEEGMIVNRGIHGEAEDYCDSLLFSSLYYVSLKKLGFSELAEKQWSAIEQSKLGNLWLRHPGCSTPTSRDMILGLTLALIQKPHNFKQHLNELLAMIDEKDGYIGDGAFYVSYLTPGIAEILRSFARIEGLRYDMIPDPVRRGFSTSELSVAFAKVGYRLHLHALLVMLELELIELDRTKMRKPRSVVRNIKNITQPFVPKSLSLLRLEYVSQIMIEKEPGNLFFKYLRIKTARALSSHWRHQLMGELLRMPQFPTDRLPNNCDRKADYLWQRAEKEYAPDPRNQCAKIYSGVDFVWLAALLLESD